MQTSTRTDLIPQFGERPSVLKVDGWTCYVSIHDQEYLRMKKEWRKRIIAAHPDKHCASSKDRGWKQATARFLSQQAQYRRWMRSERCWYWKLKMMPPDWRGPLTPPDGWVESRKERRLEEVTMRN
jgi:hypothetical protein